MQSKSKALNSSQLIGQNHRFDANEKSLFSSTESNPIQLSFSIRWCPDSFQESQEVGFTCRKWRNHYQHVYKIDRPRQLHDHRERRESWRKMQLKSEENQVCFFNPIVIKNTGLTAARQEMQCSTHKPAKLLKWRLQQIQLQLFFTPLKKMHLHKFNPYTRCTQLTFTLSQ